MRFFDTHAILGILFGEPRYEAYRREPGYTHPMNVLEALVRLLREGWERPWGSIQALGLGTVRETDSDLLQAAVIKANPAFKARNLSHVDALGLAIARRTGMPFLSGDPGVLGLDGVEYVGAT